MLQMNLLPHSFPEFPKFPPGEVWLVGAGPGDPSLITVLGVHALRTADCIVHDALVDSRLFDLAKPQAVFHFVGKRGGQPSPRQVDINAKIVELAKSGLRVLRLKGGDPFVFGRGGEEIAVLARERIPFRVVPGITSGLAAAALAGIPATTRDTNHAVILATGHLADDSDSLEPWQSLARVGQPIILYMAMSNLAKISTALQRGGFSGNTPVAIIASASTPDERVIDTCLKEAASTAKAACLEPPAIVVVGNIAALRTRTQSSAVTANTTVNAGNSFTAGTS